MSSFDVIVVLPYPISDHPSFPEGLLKKSLELAGIAFIVAGILILVLTK